MANNQIILLEELHFTGQIFSNLIESSEKKTKNLQTFIVHFYITSNVLLPYYSATGIIHYDWKPSLILVEFIIHFFFFFGYAEYNQIPSDTIVCPYFGLFGRQTVV